MNKPIIIMISGKQGSGKSSLATMLRNMLPSHGVTPHIVKFAEVIYKMHDAALAVAAEYGVPVLKKEGALLQYLGSNWGRDTKGEDVWVNAVKHKVLSIIGNSIYPPVFIIDDCRFENEFHCFDELKELGVVSVMRVRLRAPESERKARCESWRNDVNHISEIGLDKYDNSERFDMYYYTGNETLVDVIDIANDIINKSVLRKKF